VSGSGTSAFEDIKLDDYDTHEGRHVAWWWVCGGSEGEDGKMVWEPLYNKRHKWEAVRLMAQINKSVELGTTQAVKEDLIYFDDFRITPDYLPERYERRTRSRQEPAEPEGAAKDSRPATKPAEGRKKDARKAKQLIREALGK
jgi:hypothetical protein